jgi:Ca2+-transporting ATPase
MDVPALAQTGTLSGDPGASEIRYQPVEEVWGVLDSAPEGLSPEEARRRLSQYGPNTVHVAPPTPWWRILLDQFKGVVVLLLVAAMLVAAAMGDGLESLAIGVVLLLNGGIGFTTELRARRAMEGLKKLEVREARVVRAGETRQIAASELVPGDVLVLEPGDAVPADARVFESSDLRLSEAALTGESVAVLKGTDPLPRGSRPEALADRRNSVFKGTLVASGSGRAVVSATGPSTELGRVADLVQRTEDEETPLERHLDRLGRRLVVVALGVAALVTAIGVLRGEVFSRMLETGLALAIAAVPEGLPAVATITLALGMRRMVRRNALVRRLPAVETLGSCTVVCTDKTGTLTAGAMVAVRYVLPEGDVEVTGTGYEPEGEFGWADGRTEPLPASLGEALRCGVLPNRARVVKKEGRWVVEGDPTEGALVVAARKGGMERSELAEANPELAELPFAASRMFMATAHGGEEGAGLFVKGAPERVLDRCEGLLGADGEVPLTNDAREEWRARAEEMGAGGLRVLALARGDRKGESESLTDEAATGLTLVGLVGLLDPPDRGVADTIRSLDDAGVRTVMITGDLPATGLAVASSLGIQSAGGAALTGPEVASLDDEALRDAAEKVAVYARVDPEGKLRIVDALQARGEVVGMLGDGVNDAAAIRSADVGVAMGIRGTDVARETADLVLLDDRFETVGVAVEEGRVIFDNIRKFIFYLFSCNLSEVLVLLLAGIAGAPLPLLPLQILWLNLLTDVLPALALAVEPPEPGVMSRPPREPGKAIMSAPFLKAIFGYSTLLTAATLGVFVWGLRAEGIGESGAVTLAFTTLAFTQLMHALNARTRGPILGSGRLFANRWLWLGAGTAALLQVAAVHLPALQTVLRTVPLTAGQWGVVLAASAVPLLLGQLWKVSRVRLHTRAQHGASDGDDAADHEQHGDH